MESPAMKSRIAVNGDAAFDASLFIARKEEGCSRSLKELASEKPKNNNRNIKKKKIKTSKIRKNSFSGLFFLIIQKNNPSPELSVFVPSQHTFAVDFSNSSSVLFVEPGYF